MVPNQSNKALNGNWLSFCPITMRGKVCIQLGLGQGVRAYMSPALVLERYCPALQQAYQLVTHTPAKGGRSIEDYV